MGDPLSALSGIAGIASAGVQLSISLYEISNKLINAPKEVAAVASELTNLASIFDHLWTTLDSNRKLFKKDLVITAKETLDRFEALQKDVKDIIMKVGHWERLKWLFKGSRVAELMVKIRAVRSNLDLLLSIIQIAVTINIGKKRSRRKKSAQEKKQKELELQTKQQELERYHRYLAESSAEATRQTIRALSEQQFYQQDIPANELLEFRYWKEPLRQTAAWLYYRTLSSTVEGSSFATQKQRRGYAKTVATHKGDEEASESEVGDEQAEESRQIPSHTNALPECIPHHVEEGLYVANNLGVNAVDDLLETWTTLSEQQIAENRPPPLKKTTSYQKSIDKMIRATLKDNSSRTFEDENDPEGVSMGVGAKGGVRCETQANSGRTTKLSDLEGLGIQPNGEVHDENSVLVGKLVTGNGKKLNKCGAVCDGNGSVWARAKNVGTVVIAEPESSQSKIEELAYPPAPDLPVPLLPPPYTKDEVPSVARDEALPICPPPAVVNCGEVSSCQPLSSYEDVLASVGQKMPPTAIVNEDVRSEPTARSMEEERVKEIVSIVPSLPTTEGNGDINVIPENRGIDGNSGMENYPHRREMANSGHASPARPHQAAPDLQTAIAKAVREQMNKLQLKPTQSSRSTIELDGSTQDVLKHQQAGFCETLVESENEEEDKGDPSILRAKSATVSQRGTAAAMKSGLSLCHAPTTMDGTNTDTSKPKVLFEKPAAVSEVQLPSLDILTGLGVRENGDIENIHGQVVGMLVEEDSAKALECVVNMYVCNDKGEIRNASGKVFAKAKTVPQEVRRDLDAGPLSQPDQEDDNETNPVEDLLNSINNPDSTWGYPWGATSSKQKPKTFGPSDWRKAEYPVVLGPQSSHVEAPIPQSLSAAPTRTLSMRQAVSQSRITARPEKLNSEDRDDDEPGSSYRRRRDRSNDAKQGKSGQGNSHLVDRSKVKLGDTLPGTYSGIASASSEYQPNLVDFNSLDPSRLSRDGFTSYAGLIGWDDTSSYDPYYANAMTRYHPPPYPYPPMHYPPGSALTHVPGSADPRVAQAKIADLERQLRFHKRQEREQELAQAKQKDEELRRRELDEEARIKAKEDEVEQQSRLKKMEQIQMLILKQNEKSLSMEADARAKTAETAAKKASRHIEELKQAAEESTAEHKRMVMIAQQKVEQAEQAATDQRRALKLAYDQAEKAKLLIEEYELKLKAEVDARLKAETAQKEAETARRDAEEKAREIQNTSNQRQFTWSQTQYSNPWTQGTYPVEPEASSTTSSDDSASTVTETTTETTEEWTQTDSQNLRPVRVHQDDLDRDPSFKIIFPMRMGWKEQETKSLTKSMSRFGFQPLFEEVETPCIPSQFHEQPGSGGCQLRGTALWQPPGPTLASELYTSFLKGGWRPSYVRTNEYGETWFLGRQPVHVIMFRLNYIPQAMVDDQSENEHEHTKEGKLYISKEWVEKEALDEIGYKHTMMADWRVSLDPKLTHADIETAVARSFLLRESRLRKKYRDFTPTPSVRRFEDLGSVLGDARSSSSSLLSINKPSRFRSFISRSNSRVNGVSQG